MFERTYWHMTEIQRLEWFVSLELISTIEARNFYEKMGFADNSCTWGLNFG